MPLTSYVTPQASSFTPPDNTPSAPLNQRIDELTYRDLVGSLTTADLATITDDQAYVGTLATRPASTGSGYDQWTQADGGEYTKRNAGDWTPNAMLDEDIGLYNTTFAYSSEQDFDADAFGDAVLIGDEICRIESIDTVNHTITVARGCVDTIPVEHFSGETMWFFDNDVLPDGVAYADGEEVFAKLLTRGTSGTLSIDDAVESSVVVAHRQGRPYPPANVLIEGDNLESLAASYPTGFDLTWNDRDRILQQDQLVGHTEASVGPEAGTTYTVRIYDDTDTLVRTDSAATSPWTYDAAMMATDGSPPFIRLELESERDTLVSWNTYSVEIALV